MTDAWVETKLRRPATRRTSVLRGRLVERLGGVCEARLTLLAAPAGFGKTTLLATWLATQSTSRIAWVSLDERDADPTRFWGYLLTAIDRAAPGSAAAAISALPSGSVPLETLLAGVVNELSVAADDLIVVLDDYHLAEGPAIQPGMAFLVDHLPPQVHLVVSTRADPALPLARLRARGELLEVRVHDLRFTDDEAADLLTGLGLSLSDGEVSSLESRTEGWAAALQLAALSLRGHHDPAGFIAGFTGDDRFVVDYLAQEVLDRQPPDVRRFLVDTSILTRLTGPLCDAVTDSDDGAALLESLERANLFVIPLDDQRRWYRYHHLFGDVLRSHLAAERPGDLPTLHRRASDWYAQHGHPESAVSHALAAGDAARAAELAELAVPALRRDRREDVIRRWVDELPAEAVADRPVLALELIGGLSASNRFAGLAERLDAAEVLLRRPLDQLVIVDQDEFRRLPALAETYRAALALVGGDPVTAASHAEKALDLAREDDLLSIAAASALCGLAAWPTGDLATAHRTYLTAARTLEQAGHVADVLGCCITLGDLELTQGRLAAAEATFRSALDLVERRAAGATVRGVADMYVGLARVAWERGDDAAAASHLDRAAELGDGAGLPQNAYRWRVGLASLRDARGDTATAIALLDEAARLYVGDFAPDVRPVVATRARLLAARGDVAGARRWLAASGLDAASLPSYLHEYELVTVARILLAEHAAGGRPSLVAEVTELLQRLLPAAEAGDRVASVIETLILQARASLAGGQRDPALRALSKAVRLAEPEGWVRLFTAEGGPLRQPLQELAGRRDEGPFASQLLEALRAHVMPRPETTRTPLVEPLSSRELDVLRYLASDLDGPGIARELSVSLSTVRSHTQHIYAKLGVTNRRAAVRRAHQLNLFGRPSSG